MSSRPEERLVEFLVRREEDPEAGAPPWSDLDPGVARELVACARVERELSGLSLAVRGHRERAGPWALIRPIGEGAAGPVYLAERARDGARAAVRLLVGPAAGPILAAARSFREWRHEAAAAVLDTGDDWIATELSGGVSLGRVLAALRRDPPADLGGVARPLLRALSTVGEVLSAAHEDGRHHGGVSPRKLDLDRTGGLRIRDFGFDPTCAARPPTPDRPPVGSPLHLAPEQAGAPGEVGPATDVFSLATVAFEVAAGVPPATGRSLSEVLAGILSPSPRPLGPLAPWAAPDLLRAIDAARSPDPADRPGMAELAEALGSA